MNLWSLQSLFREMSMSFNISESFLGKGTTGRALEVIFKIKGFLPVIEGNCSFYKPGSVF